MARRDPALRLLVGATLLVAAVGLGVALGHVVWSPTTGPSTSNAFPYPRIDFPGGGGNGFRSNGEFPSYGGAPGAGASSGGPADATSIEAKVDPALVDVNSTFDYQGASGAGTGIVLTSSGEVITNNHVINGATSISVTDVGNGKSYSATVVGYEDARDLAVLQLQGASGLHVASIGNSSTATVGESVLAIGNAGGAGGTPTAAGGTITALGQSITADNDLNGSSEQLTGLVRTSADVQPGDSGGPLVDGAGEVLGIDAATSSSGSGFFSGTSTSSGYAIPINSAISVANTIEAGAGTNNIHVGPTAFLGVLLSLHSDSSGVQIESVVTGGAAAHAGLAAGDVITSIDGRAVSSPAGVSSLLVPLHPGDTVTVNGVQTSGRALSVKVVLGSGPPA